MPTERDAMAIVEAELGRSVQAVRPFQQGGGRFVFECHHDDGIVVARLGRNDEALEPAVAWHDKLAALGLPVPTLLAAGTRRFPFMLLTRLPGTDLGNVVAGLAEAQ